LYTVRTFNKDFHLKLQFRASLKSDSGVYLRGPQLQVRDFIRRGEQKQLKKFKNDDWNELDITVRGGRLLTVVNGRALANRDVLGGRIRPVICGGSTRGGRRPRHRGWGRPWPRSAGSILPSPSPACPRRARGRRRSFSAPSGRRPVASGVPVR